MENAGSSRGVSDSRLHSHHDHHRRKDAGFESALTLLSAGPRPRAAPAEQFHQRCSSLRDDSTGQKDGGQALSCSDQLSHASVRRSEAAAWSCLNAAPGSLQPNQATPSASTPASVTQHHALQHMPPSQASMGKCSSASTSRQTSAGISKCVQHGQQDGSQTTRHVVSDHGHTSVAQIAHQSGGAAHTSSGPLHSEEHQAYFLNTALPDTSHRAHFERSGSTYSQPRCDSEARQPATTYGRAEYLAHPSSVPASGQSKNVDPRYPAPRWQPCGHQPLQSPLGEPHSLCQPDLCPGQQHSNQQQANHHQKHQEQHFYHHRLQQRQQQHQMQRQHQVQQQQQQQPKLPPQQPQQPTQRPMQQPMQRQQSQQQQRQQQQWQQVAGSALQLHKAAPPQQPPAQLRHSNPSCSQHDSGAAHRVPLRPCLPQEPTPDPRPATCRSLRHLPAGQPRARPSVAQRPHFPQPAQAPQAALNAHTAAAFPPHGGMQPVTAQHHPSVTHDVPACVPPLSAHAPGQNQPPHPHGRHLQTAASAAALRSTSAPAAGNTAHHPAGTHPQVRAHVQPKPPHAANTTGNVPHMRMHAASAPAHVMRQAKQPDPLQSVCPYEACPGIFAHCGSQMSRLSLPDGDAWRCGACGFVALGEPQEPTIRLALEIVPAPDDNLAGADGGSARALRVFVRPVGRSRRAVQAAGGVLALLQQHCGMDAAAASEAGPEHVAYPAAELPALRAALRAQRLLEMPAGDVPAWVEASYAGQVERAAREEVEAALLRMPATLRHSMMPFQEEGVRFGLERRGRCLIGDEMGVGKTVQAIALAACHMHEWAPLLIICPASIRLLWCEELEKWLPSLLPADVTVVQGNADWGTEGRQADRPAAASPPDNTEVSVTAADAPRGGNAAEGGGSQGHSGKRVSFADFERSQTQECDGDGRGRPRVVVTSYHMAANLSCRRCTKYGESWGRHKCPGYPHCLAAGAFPLVIVDESHHLRTAGGKKDSAQTEAARRLVRSAQRAVMLTGTPSVTRPFDLAGQLHSLAPARLHGVDAFDEFKTAFSWRYCQRRLVAQRRGREGKRWAQSGAERLRELAGVLRRDFMVRRLKQDVLPQLPAKRRQVVRLDRPSMQDYNQADSIAFQAYQAEQEQEQARSGQDAAAAKRFFACRDGVGEAAGDRAESEDEGSDDDDDADEGAGGRGRQRCSKWHFRLIGREITDENRDLPVTTAQHLLGLAKLPQVCEFLEAHVFPPDAGASSAAPTAAAAPPPKLLLFAHHRTVMDRLHMFLQGYDCSAAAAELRQVRPAVGHVRIDGSTEHSLRAEMQQRFASDPDCTVALLSMNATAVGLNFSAATTVVFAEVPDTADVLLQAEGRAHRLTSRAAVNVYVLLCKRSRDTSAWCRLADSLERQAPLLRGAGAAVDTRKALHVDGIRELKDVLADTDPSGQEPAAACLPDGRRDGVQLSATAADPGETLAAAVRVGDDASNSMLPAQQPFSTGGAGTQDSAADARAQSFSEERVEPQIVAAVLRDAVDACVRQVDGEACCELASRCGAEPAQQGVTAGAGSQVNAVESRGTDASSKGVAEAAACALPAGDGAAMPQQQPEVSAACGHILPGACTAEGGTADSGGAVSGCGGGQALQACSSKCDPSQNDVAVLGALEAVLRYGDGEPEPAGGCAAGVLRAGQAGSDDACCHVPAEEMADVGRSGPQPPAVAPPDEDDAVNGGNEAGVYFMMNMHTDNVTLLHGDGGQAPLGIKVPLHVLQPQHGTLLAEQAARLAEALRPLLDRDTNGGAAKMPWGGMACLEASCDWPRLRGVAVRACRFGAEWAALSAMQRFQVGGAVLDLDAASGLSVVHAGGAAAAAATQVEEEACFLRSIDRRNVRLRLKEGEEWREATVTVPTSSGHKVMAFDQPVGPAKAGRLQRLCCNCKRVIRDASAVDGDATLSMLDLFCQTKCQNDFMLLKSTAAIRRQLFAIEAGRCQKCKLDTEGLLRRIKSLPSSTAGRVERKRVIVKASAEWGRTKETLKAAERLARHPVAGLLHQHQCAVPQADSLSSKRGAAGPTSG
eukprot:jgi/Ulvmu1/11535/UM078_0024.1